MDGDLLDNSLNFDKICRICLLETTQMYSIFDNNLSELITACASMNISYNDGLPERICSNCYEKISDFYKFKKLCEQSNAKLQEMKNNRILLLKESPTIGSNLDCAESESLQQNGKDLSQNASVDQKLTEKTQLYITENCYVTYNDTTYKYRVKTDGISYICSICSNILTSKQLLKYHIIVHLQSKLYFCKKCGKGYAEEYSLVNHMLRHVDDTPTKRIRDKRHVCSYCRQSFGGRFHLNMHKRMHFMKTCQPILIRRNKSENLLPTCEYVKSSNTPFKSKRRNGDNDCTKGSVNRADHKPTNDQVSNLTSKPEKLQQPYDCNICNKTFKNKINLIHHVRRHNGEKPYVCAVCGKAFVTSTELRSHDRKHTGIKSKHVCEICEKDFASPNALEIHMRKHTGERPFSCEECGRSYKEIGTLRKHIRIMHKRRGNKQYICDICGRETVSPSALVIHKRIHTGERPFLCAECGNGFVSQARLNKHKKSHKDVFL